MTSAQQLRAKQTLQYPQKQNGQYSFAPNTQVPTTRDNNSSDNPYNLGKHILGLQHDRNI